MRGQSEEDEIQERKFLGEIYEEGRFFNRAENGRLIIRTYGPLLQIHHDPETTGAVPLDDQAFLITKREWDALNALVQIFFSAHSDAELIAENEQRATRRRSAREERAKQKTTVARAGFIYILRGESGHYKIGRTKALAKRTGKLATQAPYQVEQIHSFPCDDMVAAEAELHRRYDGKRDVGEWFLLTAEDIEWLKSIREWKAGDWAT